MLNSVKIFKKNLVIIKNLNGLIVLFLNVKINILILIVKLLNKIL